jgi:flagellar hook-associated protein 2
LSANAQRYLSSAKQDAVQLKTSINNLNRSGSSVFTSFAAQSSNEKALTVNISNQSMAKDFLNSGRKKEITVSQLAVSQINKGTSLSSKDVSAASAGVNQFTLSTNGKTFEFSVEVNATDTVRTVQEKMANAINSQRTGVTAEVVYSKDAKESQLVLSSNQTGAHNHFKISDTAGKGNLVSTLGAGQIKQQALDAVYTVNGVGRTSASNTASIGDGFTATFNTTTESKVSVTAKKDLDGIYNAVSDIVNSFNNLLSTAKGFSGDSGAQYLQQRLNDIASSYSFSLSNMGVTRNANGYLEINENKLKKAFAEGPAERNLGSESFGFTQRLSRLSDQVASNPNQFLSRQTRSVMNDAGTGGINKIWQDYFRYMSSNRLTNMQSAAMLLNMNMQKSLGGIP